MADNSAPLKLIGRKITLEEACDDEDNILQELDYPQQRLDFCVHLLQSEGELLKTVARHLNISPESCKLSPVEEWRHGSFNWCIPVYLDWKGRSRVLLRIPLPYKVGEIRFPGNVDEKLRCEAATYIYIEENNSDIPVPKLWGFGFTNGANFTAVENTSLFYRFSRYLYDRLRSAFDYPMLSPFVRCPSQTNLDTGYLLLDYVEKGEMLSQTFDLFKDDERRRKNLFRDLSRILLSLGRVSQPRIGSFTLDDRGILSLTNRPLTLRLQCLENEGVPTGIDRLRTYTSVESYLLDLLSYHDNRLVHQPNSINDEEDGQKQMTAITIMRSLLLQFINPQTRQGPFVLMLTDIHQSNIFVDDDWHITSLIDLEWACSLPIEVQHPPYWITGQRVDRLIEGEFDTFGRIREEFMSIFEQEEKLNAPQNRQFRTNIMQKSWELGTFWYCHALDTPKGFYNLFTRHIQPRFSAKLPFREVSPFWHINASQVILSKLNDRRLYLEKLKQAAMVQSSDTDTERDTSDSGF